MRQSVLFVASCSFVRGQSPENFQLLSVNKDNFAELSKGKTVLLRFCDPSLPQCMAISPTWDSLTQAYKQIMIGDVDCGGAGKSFCEAQGVSTFPAFKYGQADQLKKYDGPTDEKSLRQLARSTASGVQPITTQFPSEFLARAPSASESTVPTPAPSDGAGDVSCGKTRAATCSACPKKEGSVTWCSGDCLWDERQQVCATKKSIVDSLPSTTFGGDSVAAPPAQRATGSGAGVSCGKTRADSCSLCPKVEGSVTWCGGDCLWNEQAKTCADKAAVPTGRPDSEMLGTATVGGAASGGGAVSCGKGRAATCSACPKTEGNVASWCSGDCLWDERGQACSDRAATASAMDAALKATFGTGAATQASAGAVSCGRTRADTCAACPKPENDDNVAHWCSGDCLWNEKDKVCATKSAVPEPPASELKEFGTSNLGPTEGISCGKRSRALTCGECPKIDGLSVAIWCNGDCLWNEKEQVCVAKSTITEAMKAHEL